MEKPLTRLLDEIDKKFTPPGASKPIITRGDDDDLPMKFIPCTSPAIGHVLGTGGWGEGRLHEFFGKESSGKTSLMLLALKDCYEFYGGTRPIAYIDIEHAFDRNWAAQLGVPLHDLILVQPMDAESATDIMQTLIVPDKKKPDFKGVCAIGFDSIGAAMSWREHQTFEVKGVQMGGAASVMARNVKMMTPLARIYDCTVFYANQLRADMEGYNRPMTPGGLTPKHMMSIRLYLRLGRDKWMDKLEDGSEVQVGNQVIFKTVKNKLGPAYREGWSNFYFTPSKWYSGIGFDIEADIQALGLATGVIQRNGGWYNYGTIKAQGRDAFFEAIKQAGMYDALMQEVKARLDTKRPTMSSDEFTMPEAADDIEIDDPEV